MRQEFLRYLQSYSPDPYKVNRIIVSNFLYSNKIDSCKNLIIESLRVKRGDADFKDLEEVTNEHTISNIEELIEVFEFVISPSDKIINGAVYTPKYIREFIVENSVNSYGGELSNAKTADISCGCGGFLLTLSENLKNRTGKFYREIFEENLFGIDIAEYSIERTKILLTLWALVNGEDEEQFNFNLYKADSLTFNWSTASEEIKQNNGFDIIVGNPPYVCSRNMEADTLALMQNWEVARTGHPDLYIPFFQIGLDNLNPNGALGYITVNTFIKSINGRALRHYFADNNINLTILSFGGEQVFKDRNTYTCICFLKYGNGRINFIRTTSSEIEQIDIENLTVFEYNDLNHHDGWNLVNDKNLIDYIDTVENVGIPFKELYNTKNGIATLKNDVYKFREIRTDSEFYYLADESGIYPIERKICRDIVNANKIKSIKDIDRLRERIIFPYDDQTRIIPEEVMQVKFPEAYKYLQTKKKILATRDKEKRKYETWYAYGRRQSMDIHAYKLFFPHICERPTFVICDDKDLLFYNGIAVVSESLEELQILKKILESDLFFKYIKNTTKDYASGYISMSRNYLKNFGVYQFQDDEEKENFLALKTKQEVEEFLEAVYGLTGQIT